MTEKLAVNDVAVVLETLEHRLVRRKDTFSPQVLILEKASFDSMGVKSWRICGISDGTVRPFVLPEDVLFELARRSLFWESQKDFEDDGVPSLLTPTEFTLLDEGIDTCAVCEQEFEFNELAYCRTCNKGYCDKSGCDCNHDTWGA